MNNDLISFIKTNNWTTCEDIALAIAIYNRLGNELDSNFNFIHDNELPPILKEELKYTNGYFLFEEQLRNVYSHFVSKSWADFQEWLEKLNNDSSPFNEFTFFDLSKFLIKGNDEKFVIPYPQNLIYEILQVVNPEYENVQIYSGKAIVKYLGNIIIDEEDSSFEISTTQLDCKLIEDKKGNKRIKIDFDIPHLKLNMDWEYGINFNYWNTEKISALGADCFYLNNNQLLIKIDPFVENLELMEYENFGMVCLFEDVQISNISEKDYNLNMR